MNGCRTEQELLVLCVQAPFDNDKLFRFEKLLRAPIDWEYLIEASITHAVTPLLCRTLDMASASAVPADVLLASREHLETNRTKNISMTKELLRILDGLDKAGVPAVPFKGPILAERFYGDLGLRRFRDLDFLVPEKSAAETVLVLRSLDYVGTGETSCLDKSFRPSPRQIAASWRQSGEYIFFHPETEIAVEPHWAFAPPTLGHDIDYPSILSRAGFGRLADHTILELSPADTLLGLAMHGAKEGWSRLQCAADLNRAVKHHADLDWTRLLDDARRAGTRRILLVGLQLLRLLFGTTLDPRVSDAIASDPLVPALALERSDVLFEPDAGHISHAALSRDWLRMLERPIDKARYVFRTLTTPRVQHFEMLPLPDNLFAAYYAIKPAHDYIALPLWLAAKRHGLHR